MDNVLVYFDGTVRPLKSLEYFINSIHQDIKFTTGMERNDLISFLGLKISILNTSHDFYIFHLQIQ